MNRRLPLAAALLAASSLACGPRAFTRGVYADPNAIELLSDQFNENDLQLIAKKMVESLTASKAFGEIQGRPALLIGRLRNSTSEHIDMRSLGDKIAVQLQKTDRFTLLDKAGREELAEEYDYQGSGYVKDGAAKGPGQQVSADFILSGDISSIVQEVGADKIVYYKMTAKLLNVRTGAVAWADEKELRKKFEKRGVGF